MRNIKIYVKQEKCWKLGYGSFDLLILLDGSALFVGIYMKVKRKRQKERERENFRNEIALEF